MAVALSILIPARNEMFLGRTIEDILTHSEAEIEVIAVLDGYTDPVPPIPTDPRVGVITNKVAQGQRAACNQAAREAVGKYVMKVDAHCAFDQGFDRKLLQAIEGHDDWTIVPVMKNLHAFDWVCPDGHRRYQGPSGPCQQCGKPVTRDVVWIAKKSPNSISFCFDAEPHFQYFGEYSKRPEGQGEITKSMSLQGSCFMMTKEKYWELGVCDETLGSWGSQGIEVACKTWLSGGEVRVLHNTWYAHMFRTQGGDFSFPYHQPQSQVEKAKKTAKALFFENKWPKQIRPLSWLVEQFWPVKGWTEDDLKQAKEAGKRFTAPSEKGIVYYTNNKLPIKMSKTCKKWIGKSRLPIVCVSSKPTDFGENIVFNDAGMGAGEAIARKILTGLERSKAEIVFLCESDVLYHPSHFDFTPPDKNTIYYNENIWYLRMTDGHCLHYDVKQLSGLCAYRETLITHFKERVALIEKEGFSLRMGYEPMTHHRIDWPTKFACGAWQSVLPNVDIRHEGNATGSRWRKEQFRNQQLLINWIESEEIPAWGKGVEIAKALS